MSRQTATAHLAVPVGPRDHIRGPKTAPLTMVEYGDFECPHCAQAYPIVETLVEQFGHQMRFAYRHFPLTQVHPHAEAAAEAAEAAGAQRKFWEMHSVLFEHQQALEPEDLALYAAALGLDVNRFADELARHMHAAKVRDDFMGGVRSGVNGTPTFFINGVRHDGSFDYESLLEAIQEIS